MDLAMNQNIVWVACDINTGLTVHQFDGKPRKKHLVAKTMS